jgi:hypothetical protein
MTAGGLPLPAISTRGVMAKEFRGEALPAVAAAQGNPQGVQAADDVTFKGVKVVTKGEYYSWRYLAEIEAGCNVSAGKPKGEENKAAQPSENK